jgi:hypothetical protein
MSSVLEEFVSVLGFEIDDEDLKEYEKLQESVHKNLKRIAIAGSAAAAGVSIYLNAVANATDATFKFSKTVGAGFGEVQRLTHATEIWGGTAADVMSTLSSLSKIISSAARGTGGGETFGILGLSPTDAQGNLKTSIALLSEVADKVKNLGSAAEQAEFASRLGISENLILLLRQGSTGIAELGAELDGLGFVMTEEQGMQAEAYVDAMVRAKFAARSLGQEIGLRLMPQMTEAIQALVDWRVANDDLIDSNLDNWMDTLSKAMRPLAIFAALISGALLVWVVAANLAAAGIVALGAAIALLVDDVKAFLEGRKGTVTEGASNLAQTMLGAIPEPVQDFFSAIGSGLADKASQIGDVAGGGFDFLSGLAGGGQTTNSSATTIAPIFNIQSTDPAGAAREVDGKMQELYRGAHASLLNPARS